MSVASKTEWQEYYDYLDELRAEGTVNMFGAAPYLAQDRDMPLSEAREILQAWMKEFSE